MSAPRRSVHAASLEEAFVLHARPYRDTSLLLEVFSREQGRVGLVARGARGGRKRLAEQLQPFAPLLLSWRGQGELATLTGAEPAGPALLPPTGGLLSGFYLNELLIRLLHRGDAHPHLFDVYRQTLALLGQETDEEAVLRRFERLLLQEIGYGLQLEHEADSGEPVEADRLYDYLPEQGPLPAVGDAPRGVRVHGQTLLALARDGDLDARGRREAKRLMRAALAVHLGDRPLQSRELYRQQRTL